MSASMWLMAGLVCAQIGPVTEDPAAAPASPRSSPGEAAATTRRAVSRIAEVTVYQGEALVTREVQVPEGEGTIELIVGPLPEQTVERSLFTESLDGSRVLSTRFRSQAIASDMRLEVRSKQAQLKKIHAEGERLKMEISVQAEDLLYLQGLGRFTSAMLTSLTEKGRVDSDPIITLSKFVMEHRGTKSKSEIDLRERLKAKIEEAVFINGQLAELSAGTSRVERDAVIIVHKTRARAATVRLGYVVGAATWSPQYRLRAGAADAPVGLEYLASVVQQTGEPWNNVRLTLSTALPSLDSAPPELLPLKMAIAGAKDSGPVDAHNDQSQKINAELSKLVDMPFKGETPLEEIVKHVKRNTKSAEFPDGIPIYVDPIGLQEAEKTLSSSVLMDLAQVPLGPSLQLLLKQLALGYAVKDGMMTITSLESLESSNGVDLPYWNGDMAGLDGDVGLSAGQAQAIGRARLNQAAATDQAEELRVAGAREAALSPIEKENPSVTFAVSGSLDLPTRREPQLLEVARVDLAAEFYAKAVPVLTPRVYRMAKLTNKSEYVVLPGEATVYVGRDFVGRMRLPLVAAGEPFIAGFGVDPQVQVSRRLVRKSRSLQGGNQVFDYEFRIGLRNYRPAPVKVQLWERLPKPEGEAVAVNLLKTSAELSKDPGYQRTARTDNLLFWEVDVPQGTVGDHTKYIHYEFRLEYAKELPQPRFLSGGLREAPIGGGAMGGGMGGMGGMR